MAIPQDANQRWSLDFVSDTLTDGRRFRILCVIDDFSRECLATVVDNSISGERVARELDIIAEHRGYPCMIVSDNGTELAFSRPGKPTDNAFIESFNGKFRSECLNAHWFLTLDDARLKMEEWRKDYNTVRPHSAIGNKPPISLMKGSSAASAT